MNMEPNTVGVSSEVDVELPPPAQLQMEPAAGHAAFIPNDAGKPTQPNSSDALYSKLVCLTCGVGELLGEVICGEHVECCCIQCMEALGLGGKDNCLENMTACGLEMPALEFGASCKCLFCKVGCVNPLKEKPFVVINKKNIA
mmetsp:Transcript_34094/g.79216  ORF Transcript_34094/g.79216 Transcript_34094/m.79216 type:complete len:143 (-) Transcript_34094:242-670(-)